MFQLARLEASLKMEDLRCRLCRFPQRLCICEAVPQVRVKSHITVIMHRSELKIRSNTVVLLKQVLGEQVEIRFRGTEDQVPLDETGLIRPNYENLVLFPGVESQELNAEYLSSIQEPVHLLLPDGNWNQAKKAVRRVKTLRELPQVRLAPGPPSSYILRKSPKPEGVCSYEAAARALGAIEGEEVQLALETYFLLAMEHARRMKNWQRRDRL